MSESPATWKHLDARALRDWPLPEIAGDADKEARGRVLVVGGSREIVGAALLAGNAALRAGAGKLVVATGQSVALALGVALPEARVIALPETADGGFAPDAADLLGPCAQSAAVVLIGPGMMDASGSMPFMEALLESCKNVPVVLDALALDAVRSRDAFDQPILLTPHAGELAHILDIPKEDILSDPEAAIEMACQRWQVAVALKGAITWIASPTGGRWRHACEAPGLATSGSGDVLAGLIAGFAAREASLEQACGWGVVMHALAGTELARRDGPLGFLARDVAPQVPALLSQVGCRRIRLLSKSSKAAREK